MDWTPWGCHHIWPLSVAVDGGRWCTIRWGVRPGMVVSLELCARTRWRVGIGGEHSAWWMNRAWSPAVEVDATLAAMDVVGRGRVIVVIG